MCKILVVNVDKDLCDAIRMYKRQDMSFVFIDLKLISTISEYQEDFDVCLIDVKKMNSQIMTFVQEITQSLSRPVFVLARKTEEKYELKCLRSGVSDYMNYPCNVEVLIEKLRRSYENGLRINIRHVGDYSFDELINKVEYKGKVLPISDFTAKVLILLLKNQNKCLTREDIYYYIWGSNYDYSSRAIDAHIYKIRNVTNDARFKSVHGIGYMYKDKCDNQL